VGLIREQFNEKYALVQMKKHLAWYTEGLGHATECRARIFQTRSPDEVWDVFRSYWERPRPATSQTASTVSPLIA
jgi:tRNA-dihydrouridine synthase